MKVTVRNYMFPLSFSHNGWNVRLEKRIGIFKDITVEAYFSPPSLPNHSYWTSILPQQIQSVLIRQGLFPRSVSSKDLEQYQMGARNYMNSIKYPMAQSCKFSANGSLLDRFIGQNISSTQKVVDKVIDYMNHNLPKLEEFSPYGYINHLQKAGINHYIIDILSELCVGLRI